MLYIMYVKKIVQKQTEYAWVRLPFRSQQIGESSRQQMN